MPMVPSHIDSGLATLRSHLLPPALYAWRGTRDGRGRMLRTEKDKMLAGALYHPGAPEIQADLAATQAWLVRYNAPLAKSAVEQRELLADRKSTRLNSSH